MKTRGKGLPKVHGIGPNPDLPRCNQVVDGFRSTTDESKITCKRCLGIINPNRAPRRKVRVERYTDVVHSSYGRRGL
jgi:hypothetical protein